MQKVLIFGTDGHLGSCLEERFAQESEFEVTTTARKCVADHYFNYSPSRLERIIRTSRPDIIINCIASTNKRTPLTRMLITNSFLPLNLSLLKLFYKYEFIHISSNAVFSGDAEENSERNFSFPQSIYGLTKRLGDLSSVNGTILRTSFIGKPAKPENASGLLVRISKMEENDVFDIENDYLWNGITSKSLSEYICVMIKFNLLRKGVFHLGNSRIITRSELVRLLLIYLGRTDLKVKITSSKKRKNYSLHSINQNYIDSVWGRSIYRGTPDITSLISEI
jgi:dTDP-4-dehydrorhamnose reductase